MIEIARRLQDVADMLAKVEPGVTVAGPDLNGGFGLTTRHNRYIVHLGIEQLRPCHEGDSTTFIALGKLYLDPKPPDDGPPFVDLVRKGLPGNCGLYSLPDHVISTDLFGRDQVEWPVGIIVTGPGMAASNPGQNSFFITPRQSWIY